MKNNFVGIDLGTTNTVVSYLSDTDEIKVLELNNSKLIPSAIFFEEEKIVIGNSAIKKKVISQSSFMKSWKRKLGTDEVTYIKTYSKKKQTSDDIRYLVVDTNIYINHLNFEEKIYDNEKVIMPYVVRDELGYRKNDSKTDIQAKKAENLITNLINMNILEFMEFKKEFVPNGAFISTKNQNDTNDNRILAIARELNSNSDKVILLTDDVGLTQKAKSCDINVLTYKKFMLEREDFKKSGVKSITPKEATFIFLQELKKNIDKKLGEDIKKAVIAYPAVFSPVQIEQTKNAAKKAGFEEVELIKEPIAAAISCGVDSNEKGNIAVYDLGGGTFDFSIIKCKENSEIEVVIADGDENLGGDDITKMLSEILLNEIEEYVSENLNLKYDENNLEEKKLLENERKLLEISNALKMMFNESEVENVFIEGFNVTNDLKKDIELSIKKDLFEDYVIYDIVKNTEDVMKRALNEAKMKSDEIDKVVLCGGTSMISGIQEGVDGFFGGKVVKDRDLSTMVSIGATIRAKGVFLLDSDEEDSIKEWINISDFLNSSIGVRLNNDIFGSIFDYKTKLPCEATKRYGLVKDYQKVARIKIYSKKRYSDATHITDVGVSYIGEIEIEGISKYKANEVYIETTFKINNDSTIEVKADLVGNDGTVFDKKTLTTVLIC